MKNKLIPIIVFCLVLLVILIIAVNKTPKDAIVALDKDELTTRSADGDSTATTLETLVAKINKIDQERKGNQQLMLEMEQKLVELEARGQLVQRQDLDDGSKLTELDVKGVEESILDRVREEYGKLKPAQGGHGAFGSNFDEFTGEIDIGSGSAPAGNQQGAKGVKGVITNTQQAYITIGSTEFATLNSAPGAPAKATDKKSYGLNKIAMSDEFAHEEEFSSDKPQNAQQQTKKNKKKLYTIPQLAQDIRAQTLTAVIGRIPNSGQLQDPFYFKVLSSADIITANGRHLPDLEGIIWEGVAIGDRTLSCTQGKINKVSLVLADGSIVPTNVGGTGDESELGYIADKYGQPCLPGKIISNASNLLMARISARALEAAAEAEAQRMEVTTKGSTSGELSKQVVGKRSDYVRAKTAGGAMSELVEFVRERMRDSFDAVYSEPGTSVQIHLRQQIEFDLDKEHRFISYHHKSYEEARDVHAYSD